MADDASDLESYLDEMDKEIEGDDELIEGQTDEEIVQTDEEEVDGGQENNDDDARNNDDDFLDDDELEDGTIFMDADGNYYYQKGKKAVQVKPVKKEKSIVKTVAAAIKRKQSLTPQRSVKREKTANNSTETTPSKIKDVVKTPTKTASPPQTSSPPTKTSKTQKNNSLTRSSNRSKTIKTAIKIEPKTDHEPTIESTPIVIPKSNRSIKADTTISTINQTVSSEANNDQVYDFEESERNIDDPDFTVEDEDPNYAKNEVMLKTVVGLVPDESGVYNCGVCDYNTNKKYLLSRHMKTHSEERPYKCSVCERGFKTNVSLMNHINTHLGNKPHQCGDCDKSFTTSGELTRHRRYRHTGIKPHKCTECDYSSVELSKLRRHIRCHTGERPYQCPHCTYASPDTFKLKRHMRTHTGEKPYECDICHARFTQSNSLKYHRLIHSVNDKPVFQCSLCPTTCGRKTDLRLHIQKLHNTEIPFPCKRCGKELPDRYSYKMHIKTHEGEKCYRCTYCPYASISQRHLETHMHIHTDSKPYICDLCDQSFRQKQLLTRHIKLYHTENYEPPTQRTKAHICPHCDRSFAFKGNLIRHMESHDPNSNVDENKMKLKLGRMKRVRPDGTVVVSATNSFIYNEDEVMNEADYDTEDAKNGQYEYRDMIYDEENDVQYVYEELIPEEEEDIEIEQTEEILDRKPIIIKSESIILNKNAPKIFPDKGHQFKTVSVKKEVDAIEFMPIEVDEEQDFMVIEVVQDAVDEEPQEIFAEPHAPTLAARTTNIAKPNNIKTLDTITDDCFGFGDDAQADDDDIDEEEDNQCGIEIFNAL